MKTLYLVRGLPGSGKSSFVKNLRDSFSSYKTSDHFEADQYFYDSMGVYNFDINLIGKAHAKCKLNTIKSLCDQIEHVFVSNTFTTEKELAPYYDMAEDYGYRVITLIVENRHGSKSVHNVPLSTIEAMQQRFSFNLGD